MQVLMCSRTDGGEIHAWAELHELILLGTCVTFAYEKRVGREKGNTLQSHDCLQMYTTTTGAANRSAQNTTGAASRTAWNTAGPARRT
jgi:hypothetical protein